VNTLWRLFNARTSTELYSDNEALLRAFADEVLPTADKAQWQFRQDGDPAWAHLPDSAPGSKPLAMRALNSVPREDRRRTPRALLRCRLVMTIANTRYENWSKNVSLGGMLLESPLPIAMNGQSGLVLISLAHAGLSLRLQAKVQASPHSQARLVFAEADGRLLARLGQWLQQRRAAAPARKAA
jgi:hypothetical protein